MGRSLALGAVWLAAAALAAGVAWAGIGVVGDQVTNERPAPLSADEIARDVAADRTSTTTAPDGTATTGAPPSSSADDAETTTKTYRVVGGVVTLRFTPSGVTVVGASPNEGFVLDSQPAHGNGVRVEFEGDDHESRVDAWWDAQPQDRVQEDGEELEDVEDDEDDDSGEGGGET